LNLKLRLCVTIAVACVTWPIHVCGMTHSYVWHDSFVCVTWLIRMCGMTHSCVTWRVYYDWFICDTYLVTDAYIHMCDMTHSYVCHDSPMPRLEYQRVTWLMHTYDMTHSFVRHDSFIRVTWLINAAPRIPTCDMTHVYVWHHWIVWHDSWLTNAAPTIPTIMINTPTARPNTVSGAKSPKKRKPKNMSTPSKSSYRLSQLACGCAWVSGKE